MDSLEERISGMEKKVETQLTEVNSKLDLLLNKVATWDDLAKLDDKIEGFKTSQGKTNLRLEKQTGDLAKQLTALELKEPSSSGGRESDLISSMEKSKSEINSMKLGSQ